MYDFYYNTDTFAWQKYVHKLIIPLTYMLCDVGNANIIQWFSIFKIILTGCRLFFRKSVHDKYIATSDELYPVI